ncbi:MAG: GNAT family N-acetyltransferase [Dehalococcoidia bacterium]
MDIAIYARYRDAVRDAYARGIGCTSEAFATERLTIVERPEPPAWPYTALLATFGTGTVLSIEPILRSFAEAHTPAHHVQAMSPGFVQLLIEEGDRQGVPLQSTRPGICFTFGEQPAAVVAPSGLTLKLVDAAWMAEEMPRRRFENGVGEVGVAGRDFRNQCAAVLFDDMEAPVAVAGAFLTYGLFEVGIDVVRSRRGQGLAPIVVRAVTAEIVRRGEVPFYGCAATNIRSQRTALASGYVPVCSDAAITRVPLSAPLGE